MIGITLSHFKITEKLGEGGMGVVYEAEQESLGRRVAVKVLPKQSLLEEKHLRRFQRFRYGHPLLGAVPLHRAAG